MTSPSPFVLVPTDDETLTSLLATAMPGEWISPAEAARLRTAMLAASPPVGEEVVEGIARIIADSLGFPFDSLHRDKRHWNATGGRIDGRFNDVNQPYQSDMLDAARAAIPRARMGDDHAR